jgi:hypothetical protein
MVVRLNKVKETLVVMVGMVAVGVVVAVVVQVELELVLLVTMADQVDQDY